MANITLDELRTRLLAELKEKFEKTDPKKDDKDSDDKDSEEDDETDISKDSGKKDEISVKEYIDSITSMLSNITEQKGYEATEIFNDLIMAKITTKLEEMKQEVMGESGFSPSIGGKPNSKKLEA